MAISPYLVRRAETRRIAGNILLWMLVVVGGPNVGVTGLPALVPGHAGAAAMIEYSLVRDGSIMRRRLCRDCRRPVHEIGHYYCVEDAV